MAERRESTLLETIADNVDYVRGRVDQLHNDFSEMKVEVEHRLTKLEVRTGLIALAVSAIVTLAARLAK